MISTATSGQPGAAIVAAQRASKTGAGRRIGGVWVVLHAWTVGLWTAFLLGPEGARVAAGYGEWETTGRPRQMSITEWKGQRPYELTIDALYDGWSNPRRSVGYVDGEIAKLERLATRQPGLQTPPSLKTYGAIPHANLRWVIDNIEWGDRMADVATGHRWRQQATIHLVQYVAPDVIIERPRGAATPKGTRRYVIARGDTLQRIATKKLGKASRWRDIAKLNKGMRGIKLDPKKYPVGKSILVPAK
jgi:hypothetical protein